MAEGSCLALSTYVLLLCCLLALACFPVVHSEPGVPPPQKPPVDLLHAFTLNHTVPLEFYYVDDSNQGRGI
jgi:hypothetical protein